MPDPPLPMRFEALVKALQVRRGPWDDRHLIAARKLGELGDRRAVAPLAAALGGEDQKLRKAAARALCVLEPEAALPDRVLRLLLGERLDELVGLGSSGVDVLLALCPDEVEPVQARIVGVLGRIGDPRAASMVVGWLFSRPGQSRTPHSLEGWLEDLRPLFGDYAPLILRAAFHLGETSRSWSEGDNEYTAYTHDLDDGDDAVDALCRLDTPASSLILGEVAELTSLKVVRLSAGNTYGGGCERETLSFRRRRTRAARALKHRQSLTDADEIEAAFKKPFVP